MPEPLKEEGLATSMATGPSTERRGSRRRDTGTYLSRELTITPGGKGFGL